jgi:hypothetical protein
VRDWIRRGLLHRVHPRVYAFGHAAIGLRASLSAGLLYAGNDSALSHQTAAYVWGLIKTEPRVIHVATTRDLRSLQTVRLHRFSQLDQGTHDGLPVTTVPRTLLDLAATMPLHDTRRAVAEADHLGLLDAAAVTSALGRGRRGSTALRDALVRHIPSLAETRSRLEERFLMLCQDHGLPLPEVNVTIQGFTVDCLWRRPRVVVELDGHADHDRKAVIEADRRRDLALRRLGYTVHRYTWHQLVHTPELVIADLRAAIEA